jgi:hypothetical protein
MPRNPASRDDQREAYKKIPPQIHFNCPAGRPPEQAPQNKARQPIAAEFCEL